jgi:rod shape-determining protein MreC
MKLKYAGILLVFLLVSVFFVEKVKPFSISLVAPILNGIDYLVVKVDDFFNLIKSKDELIEEVKRLKQENEKLKLKILTLKHLEYENLKLKEALYIKRAFPDFDVLVGRVVGYSTDNFTKYVFINLSKKDGVEKGNLVVANATLLGIISEVTPYGATVLLISDPSFKIPARTAKTRELVFFQGMNNKYGILRYVKPDQDIRVGDIVETTDIDNKYPAGIPIGRIDKVNYREGKQFKDVLVKIDINPMRIEYVIVIKRKNKK